MTTSDKVRALVARSKKSQKEFALSVGIHPVTFCNCLKGDSFSMKTLKKIAEYQGVSIDSLLSDSTPKEVVAPSPSLNGYIEFDGHIEAVRSIEDIERLLERLKKAANPIDTIVKEPRCILFDLDNTLINSDAKRPYLEVKPLDWAAIHAQIPKYRLYDGIKEVLQWTKDNRIKVGIVSSARRDHIEKVLAHFNLTGYIDYVLGNQWAYKKPNPKLIEMALEALGVKDDNVLYIGDHDVDAEMCARASVRFAGCTWDSHHKEELLAMGCKTIAKPQEIKGLFDNLESIPLLLPKKGKSKISKKTTNKGAKDISVNTNPINPSGSDERIFGIIGAVIGDIVGSRHEFEKGFPKYNSTLLCGGNKFTDDTILTVAIADAILHNKQYQDVLWDWAHKYPTAGWGGRFRKWLKGSKEARYSSIGNGSGMRVSPVGFRAESLKDALEMAKQTALPTHGTKEGVRGAQAIAASIFLARQKKSKAEIKEYIEKQFRYDLDMSPETIVDMVNHFGKGEGELAAKSVPVAIIAFLNGEDYEGVIRTAITYGGDSDTIACMAGGIAAAYYGVPMELANNAAEYLSDDLLAIINEFDHTSLENHRITPPRTEEWNRDCVIVYGCSVIEGDSDEEGWFEVFRKRKNGGYKIRTIGVDFNETKKDVQDFLTYVDKHPEKTFLVKKIGMKKGHSIGAEKMAPLFKPLLERKNVYLPKEYLDVLK